MIAITPKRIRKAFYTTLQQMEADRSLYVKDPLRDFTREGTFSFRRTMLFMTQMESHSTNREINDFFLSLGRPAIRGRFSDWPKSLMLHIIQSENRPKPLKKSAGYSKTGRDMV